MSTLCQDVFFGRVVTNAASFSLASDGNTWASLGAAYTYNVANGKGTVSGQSTNGYSTLGGSTITDCEVSCRVTPGTTSDAMGVVLRLVGTNNHYRARFNATTFALVRNQTNTLTVLNNASFTPTAGQAYWIRARAIGTGSGGADNLWAKVWQDGTPEPTSWTVHASDGTFASGSVGIFVAANSSSDTLTYESFSATDLAENVPVASSLLVTDTFLATNTDVSSPNALAPTSSLTSMSGLDCPYGVTYFANVAAGTVNTAVPQLISDVQGITSNAWIRYQEDLYKIFGNATYSSITGIVNIGAGDFTQLDNFVKKANTAGVKICFPLQMNTWGVSNLQTLDGCFNVVAGGSTGAIYMDIGSAHGGGPNTTFQDVINVIVKRYNGDSQSQGFIDAWQIMNEEGDTHTASGCNRDKQGTWVGKTIAATAQLINQLSPNALIGAAAVRRTPTGATTHVSNWMTNMFVAAGSAMQYIYFLDFHYYRDDPTQSQDPSVSIVGGGTTNNPDVPSVAKEVATIQAAIQTAISNGISISSNIQIWMGEFGYHLYDDGTCCSSQSTCTVPSNNVSCCGPISDTLAGTYIAGPTSGNGKSAYEQMRLNGGDKVFVYDIDPRATVHNLTGCASDATATQYSNDPDSITQTIGGVYTYTAAYAAMVAYAGAFPSWSRTVQTTVYSLGSDVVISNGVVTSRYDGIPVTRTRLYEDVFTPENDLNTSRTRLYENIFAPVRSIPAKSSLLATTVGIPTDGQSLNEGVTWTDNYAPQDVNNANSLMLHDGPYPPVEALALVESVTDTATYTTLETGLTVGDSIATPTTTFNTMTSEDDLIITDSMLTTLVFRPQKQLNAKDTFTGTSETSPGTVEALTLTESAGYIAGDIPIEGLTGLESFIQEGISTSLESLSIADSSSMSAGVSTGLMSSTDSLSVTESIAYLTTVSPVDNLNAISSLGAVDSDLPGDALSALSSLTINAVSSINEVLSIGESATYTDTTLLIDFESANQTFTLIETDSLLLVDALNMIGSALWQEEMAPSTPVLTLNEFLIDTEVYTATEPLFTSDVYLASEVMSVRESLAISSSLSQSPSPIFITSLSTLDLLLSTDSYGANEQGPTSDVYLPVQVLSSLETLSVNEVESTLTTAQWTERLSTVSFLVATKPQTFVEALVISDSFNGLSASAIIKDYITVAWKTRTGNVKWHAR